MINSKDILVIDDEEIVLDAIVKIAAYGGYNSDTCSNVEDALTKLNSNHYKLIICDIMMPDHDGFELLKIIRNKRITTPVVITTGFSTLENAVRALYEGAIGFIPKPFSIEELSSIITRGLEYGRITDCNNRKLKLMIDFVPCPPRYHRLGFESWINRAEEGTVTIGITDLFLKSIGMISEIVFMNIEESVYQGGNCLRIMDNKENTHQLLAPVSGKIIDINEKLIVDHSLLEKDPYFLGWIYKMVPNNLEEELKKITPCSTDI